jgi:hypothetical protein
MRFYLKMPFTKTGLVEWLKLKALSSNLSTAKQPPPENLSKHLQIIILYRFI